MGKFWDFFKAKQPKQPVGTNELLLGSVLTSLVHSPTDWTGTTDMNFWQIVHIKSGLTVDGNPWGVLVNGEKCSDKQRERLFSALHERRVNKNNIIANNFIKELENE